MNTKHVNANLEFFKGALFMLSNVYRAHKCSVTVKDCINDIDVVDEVARASDEYDLMILREVINNLPMGCDADYTRFMIVTNEYDDIFVEAFSQGERVQIAEFDTVEEAEIAIVNWQEQIKENKQMRHE